MVSMDTPVALKMALRMAGAGEQAGGSPSAFVPKGEVGSGFSTNSASKFGWSMNVESL